MKRYIVFILSLILLYIAFQILSGWVLTTLYTPDVLSMTTNSSEESIFKLPATIQLLVALFIATLAYFISQKLLAAPTE